MLMLNNELAKPFLRWAGGKRQLINALTLLLPSEIDVYCEPFIGGGAMLFHLSPSVAYINDISAEIINVYQVIKDDVEALINKLQWFRNCPEVYYKVRNLDRDEAKYHSLSCLTKAARTVYLNKTCFNGLFRVNSKGEFNVPFGKRTNPDIVNAPTLRAVSDYLNSAVVIITNGNYADVINKLHANAFVYLDPPYDSVSSTANFDRFGKDEQVKLREHCDGLTSRGIKFMLSNSDTDFIRDQYKQYDIQVVSATRAINCDATKRGKVNEVVVRNYGN